MDATQLAFWTACVHLQFVIGKVHSELLLGYSANTSIQEVLSTRLYSYEVSFYASVQTAAKFHEVNKLLCLIESIKLIRMSAQKNKNEKQAGIIR